MYVALDSLLLPAVSQNTNAFGWLASAQALGLLVPVLTCKSRQAATPGCPHPQELTQSDAMCAGSADDEGEDRA